MHRTHKYNKKITHTLRSGCSVFWFLLVFLVLVDKKVGSIALASISSEIIISEWIIIEGNSKCNFCIFKGSFSHLRVNPNRVKNATK